MSKMEQSPGDGEKIDFVDALARLSRSCDEMRTVRLNPRTTIPIDQYPKTPHMRAGTIVNEFDEQQYARYAIQVATDNERFVAQARQWWAWWELLQVKPAAAGPEPLVLPEIREALGVAARRRKAEFAALSQAVPSATTSNVASQEMPRRIDRSYVGNLLAQILDPGLPRHLVDAVTTYLVAKGVLVEADGQLALSGSPDSLGAFPKDAVNALRAAVQNHYGSSPDAKLLGYVIMSRNRGGSGSVSQGGGVGSYSPAPPLPDREEAARRMTWERQKHIATVASMGLDRAVEFVDFVIASLRTPVKEAMDQATYTTDDDEVSADPEKTKGALLIGWPKILDAIELENTRANQVMLRRLNQKHAGPLRWVRNKPKVFHEALIRWLEGCGASTDDGNSYTDARLEFDHPAEMKRLGFQVKKRPNNPGSLAKGDSSSA